MEGYRTQFVTAAMALVSLATTMNWWSLTPEQVDVVESALLLAGWPIAMYVMRVVTRGPMKVPGGGRLPDPPKERKE